MTGMANSNLSTAGVACILAVLLSFPLQLVHSAETVIGPANLSLADGANALLAGDAAEGVRLTLIGLRQSGSKKDRVVGWSNLCAGYVMLEQLDKALDACNQAVELDSSHWRALSNRALVLIQLGRYAEAAQDIEGGLKIAPNSRKLKVVSGMLLDATDPVAPTIIIDDRRAPPKSEEK